MAVESGSKNKVKKKLKEHGITHYCPRDTGTSGIPDIIACRPDGKFLAIELKLNRGHGALSHPLSALQAKFLRDINRDGGVGYVLVELPDGWHWELIDRAETMKSFEWRPRTLDAFIEEALGKSFGVGS